MPTCLELARYAEADLLCYRADGPDALIARQAALWQPWLDWAAERFAARLRVTTGIVHIQQDAIALAALASAAAALGPWRLAGLGIAVPALGSLVLGLALAEDAIDADAACDAAMADELFQESLWGRDDQAAARRAAVRADVADAARFLALAARP